MCLSSSVHTGIESMLYFLFLSRKCNLKCIYCGEATNPTTTLPSSIEYSLDQLDSFLSNDPNPIIAFYGGEPLLNIQFLKQVMDKIPRATFLLQTNGTLLYRLSSTYLNNIDNILISLDGAEEITDFYRGKGTYYRIMQILRIILKNGYKG